MALDIEFGAVGDREVELSARHFGQQFGHFDIGILGPRELGVGLAERRHHVGMTAGGYHFDVPADGVLDRMRLAGTELVNQMHVDRIVRVTETQIFATRFGHRQTGRRHMRPAFVDMWQDFGNVFDGFDDERNAERLGESANEVVFGACRSFGRDKIRGRGITRNNAQLA